MIRTSVPKEVYVITTSDTYAAPSSICLGSREDRGLKLDIENAVVATANISALRLSRVETVSNR